MTHELKTWPPYFSAIRAERKTFELRKSDRDYKVGDTLLLKEYSPDTGYTGSAISVIVSYIMHGPVFGVSAGFCILGIKPEDKGGRTVITDLDEIAYLFSLSSKKPLEWITSKSRQAEIVKYRQAMMYYMSELSGLGFVAIGHFLGFHHTSILHSVRTVKQRIVTDNAFNQWLNEIDPSKPLLKSPKMKSA